MKAYVLNGINQLDYLDVPKPKIDESRVLIEVKAAGICGSDIPRIYNTGTYHFPTIPGHEFSGIVREVGSELFSTWKGKHVGVFPLIPCKKCFACKQGLYEMCRDYNYLGSRSDGGFADYVSVPVWNLIELPQNVSFEVAAMLEPAAVALHALKRVQLRKGMTVAVLGLGTIGLMVVKWLTVKGIATVFTTGHVEENGNFMKKNGMPTYEYCNAHKENVTEWLLKMTAGKGVDLAIDCTGFSETITQAFYIVKPEGQILMIGNPHEDMVIQKEAYWKLLRNQITVVGSWNSTFNHNDDDWHEVLKACEEEKIDLNKMITHKLSFPELKKGLDIMRNRSEFRNKIMIIK